MSRRDRAKRPDRRTPRPTGPVAASPRLASSIGRWSIAAATLAAVVALVWLGLRSRGGEREGRGPAIAGSAAALSPQAAYEKGLELSRAGRFEESLPCFERALTGRPPELWLIHYNYAGALYSAGLEERVAYGVSRPALRSSIERVALMRRALAELDAAERLAPTPRDRATVIKERGVRLQIWGFPWDAFVELRRAQWTDPKEQSLAGAADAYMLVLEHPERGPRGAAPAHVPLSPRASPP